MLSTYILLLVPIPPIPHGERCVVEDEEVLGVLMLCAIGEIKRSGNNGLPINNHDFVVGNFVFPIDIDGNLRRFQRFKH